MTDPDRTVDAWFEEQHAHAMTDAARIVRAAILQAVPTATESIKWQAPNFATDDDFATLSMRRPGTLQIILHTGAKPKPHLAPIHVDNLDGRLCWAGHNRAIITFTSPNDVNDALPEFRQLIATWATHA